MKKSDAHFEIRDDLYKIEHMFKGYQKGNLDFQALLDAIVNRVLNKADTIGMLPPTVEVPAFGVKDNIWEPEDD